MKLEPSATTKSRRSHKRSITWTAIVVISTFGTLISSQTAYAGLFSFVANMISPDQASADVRKTTSASSSGNLAYLQAATNFDPNPNKPFALVPIDGNGEILMPDIAAENSTSTADVNIRISTYTVQSGDTLSAVADMFGISMDTIKQANGLSGNTIKPGQSLIILPVTGVLYVVKAGDSLSAISKKYKVSIDDIVTYNEMTSISSPIVAGDKLVIPHGTPSATEVTTFLAKQKYKVPSFEPLLDPVWNWPSYPGYFSCPVPGGRLSQGLHGHNAIDLAIAKGTPIHAAAAGTVIISKSNGLWNGGYGNFIMISHPNGAETLYAHMSKTSVSVGEHVSQGQTIGYIGMTGMTTGPHTHFEIRNAANPFVDPALCQ